MIALLVGLIYVTGLYPLIRAWRANRDTTLFQAIHWVIAAWATWGIAGAAGARLPAAAQQCIQYLALSLTACAGVAVLGARRPGVGPWNFVLLGLLAVMLLPLAESAIAHGTLHLEGPRVLFLAATLGMIVVNYLPTRLGPAAVLLALGGAGQIVQIAGPNEAREWFARLEPVTGLVLAFVPWAAFERIAARPAADSEFDRLWLSFRDRFGLVWSQRVREQFNHAAAHAGWPVVLRWQGLRTIQGFPLPPPKLQEAMLETLHALLKRFFLEPT